MITIIDNQKTWTKPEVDSLITSKIKTLTDIGKGRRVALKTTNSFQDVIDFLALYRLGACIFLVHGRLPDPDSLIRQVVSGDDLAPGTIIQTSGSTGKPKLAVHTFDNHHFNALGVVEALDVRPGDKWLLSLPLYHVGGLAILFRCLAADATLVLNRTVDEVHFASMVPTQLIRNKSNLSYLKALLLGGASIPPHLIQPPVIPTYGCTEMASTIALGKKVLKHSELKITDDGEIWVNGPTLFSGYLDAPHSGWFPTGDLGYWDNGLVVTGRKDTMFISGGENIHPEEIEMHLMSLPGVENAVVVPVPHPEFGHRPIAFVKGQAAKEDLMGKLPKFKIPDRFLPWPERIDSSGKVNRKVFLSHV